MSALTERRFTPEEYLSLERSAAYKSQYVAGEIFAMAGAQPWHVKLVGNIVTGLNLRFRGKPCDVFFSDLRVRVKKGELWTYPDVVALCGKSDFDLEADPQSLLNPQVIFEVLSPSTEAFDRGDKFARYRQIESFKEYVLVSSDRMRVEHFVRGQRGEWTFQEYNLPTDRLPLTNLECELPLAEIYDKVALPAP
jgi:Uma2 family endonuclease